MHRLRVRRPAILSRATICSTSGSASGTCSSHPSGWARIASSGSWTGARCWSTGRGGGGEGKSLFYYDPAADVWNQVWITDRATAPGGLKHKRLTEVFEDGALRFEGTVAPVGGASYGDRTTLRPFPEAASARRSRCRPTVAGPGRSASRPSTASADRVPVGVIDPPRRPSCCRPAGRMAKPDRPRHLLTT